MSTALPVPRMPAVGSAAKRSEAAAMRRFRWFHSTRNSVEVRLTPSFRATSTATAHKLVRYRRLSLAVLSPFLETCFRFFEANGRRFASRHGAFLLAGRPAADRPYQLTRVDFMQACRKDTVQPHTGPLFQPARRPKSQFSCCRRRDRFSTAEWCRRNDRLGRLIRHVGPAVPLPVGTLPVPMIEPAFDAPLMTTVGSTALLAPVSARQAAQQ